MTGDQWFANSFEESRFNERWQFRVAAAVESVFLTVVLATGAVGLSYLTVSGGLFSKVLLIHTEPTYTTPPELETLPATQIELLHFVQFVGFAAWAVVHLVVQLLAVVAIAGCALAAVATALFAVAELELAYSPPTQSDEESDADGSDETDESIQSDTTAQDLLGETR
ncbi:hypothetical protein [Natrinema sp. DC36]|uniref:hypothetical protein n=1 Tax=Natrinema sp. DC36 TaxID=2878680 RepID=UPI001CF06093|nr:hypothetical protein [Natrinema sp. DC36]